MKKLGFLILLILFTFSGCQTLSEGEKLNQQIIDLPGIEAITLEDETLILNIKAQYAALPTTEKQFVTESSIIKIEVLEEQLNILRQLAAAEATVAEIRNAINALPPVDEITIFHREQIIGFRATYNQMDELHQSLVDVATYDLLVAYELKMENDIVPAYATLEQSVLSSVYAQLNDAILEEITEPYVLPVVIEVDDFIFHITWSASHHVVMPDGTIIMPPQYTTATFKATINGRIITEEYEKPMFLYGFRVVDMPDIDPDKTLTFAYLRNAGYGTSLLTRDYQKIDVINYSFSRIVNGKVSVLGLYYLSSIINLRREGVRIVMVIDGVSTDTRAAFVEAASSQENRQILVDSIVEVIEEYQLDGVDLDWEYPQGTIQKNNFSLLCEMLREALDATGRNLILSAAVRAGGFSTHYDLPVINQYLDYLHIMTYGMGSRTIAQHQSALFRNTFAPFSISTATNMYIDNGMDRKKVVFGIPFYVIMGDFTSTPTNPLGASITNYRSMGYGSFYNTYYNKQGFTEHFDPIAQVYYSYNDKSFATYDNPDSIVLKCEWALANGIGGVMFWEYSHDMTNGVLLDAIYQTLNPTNP